MQLLGLKLLARTKRGIDSNLYTLPVVAPRHQRQVQDATTTTPEVVAPHNIGSCTTPPPVVAPRATEPPIEPKVNPKGKAVDRKTKAPESIEITQNHRTWARENDITSDLSLETSKMLDHFKGNGEKKVDWEATWRNWMRNSMKFNRNGGNGNGHGGNRQDQNAEAARAVWANLHPEDSVSNERGTPRVVSGDLFGAPNKS
jgi:hypothetical protein